jgi:hypothetical protein
MLHDELLKSLPFEWA